MDIIPAIDLKDGKCVRLYQGDYHKETVFSEEPAEVARRWQSDGAIRLHVVDLDGAASGELENLATIQEIRRAVDLPIQLGGGVRRLETIEMLLAMKINRVILGTAAIEDTRLVTEACRRFGEAIIIAVDAKDGLVATRGWLHQTEIASLDLIKKMASLGARRFLYTDIARDGTLTEPNFEAIGNLIAQTKLPIIAAGGISSIEHLQKLSHLGVEAAVVGKALYSGDLSLPQALAAFQQKEVHKFDPSRKAVLDNPERLKELNPAALFDLLPLKPDAAVADIGCGTGFFTFPLSERLPQGKVYALDISPEMLAVFKERLAQKEACSIEALLSGEQDFPLPPGSLDGVLLFLVFHETKDRLAFLGKVKALLKPGGWIALLEWLKQPTPKGPPLEERIDQAEAVKLAEAVGLNVLWAKPIGQNHYLQLLGSQASSKKAGLQ